MLGSAEVAQQVGPTFCDSIACHLRWQTSIVKLMLWSGCGVCCGWMQCC
jgi:hypothetical protein